MHDQARALKDVLLRYLRSLPAGTLKNPDKFQSVIDWCVKDVGNTLDVKGSDANPSNNAVLEWLDANLDSFCEENGLWISEPRTFVRKTDKGASVYQWVLTAIDVGSERDMSHLSTYVSDSHNPQYAIRFVESLGQTPDASRVGNHDVVPNGVYAFAFTQGVYDLFNGDDESGYGVYLEDIGVGASNSFIMKCTIKKPLVLNSRSWQRLSDRVSTMGHVKVQEELVAQGYDAIIDPEDVIDEVDLPQVCFLINDAFEVIEKVML